MSTCIEGRSDELYAEACRIVRKHRRGSISLVQRHLRIGYNRAWRMLEAMVGDVIAEMPPTEKMLPERVMANGLTEAETSATASVAGLTQGGFANLAQAVDMVSAMVKAGNAVDRDLLEKAARAFWAGEIDDVVSIEWGEQDGCILYTHADNQDHNGRDRTYRWNPLEENRDAFELAVKLGFSLEVHHDQAQPLPWLRIVDGAKNWTHAGPGGAYEEDRLASTRRAIVRAAADFGASL